MMKNSSMMNVASDQWYAATVEEKSNIASRMQDIVSASVAAQGTSYIQTQAAVVGVDQYQILDSVQYPN